MWLRASFDLADAHALFGDVALENTDTDVRGGGPTTRIHCGPSIDANPLVKLTMLNLVVA